jgi:hypothetical protein
MSSPLSDNAPVAAERAATGDKRTDDPQSLPTLDGPPKPPPIGLASRLVGEYEVLERIPGGGMGEVYKARHRRLNKLVALKLLPASSHNSREAAMRFQREMQAVGALDHRNVVEAHDAGEQSGVVYLAMKLIDGVDLDRLVKERGSLPIAEACELVRQAALGLHYLHEKGLVHRDVKPSNLMRTPDGTIKVLDLGLARWLIEAEAGHALTGAGRVMGTPDFLAPEQSENAADADARADLYGLGGTLFYLLTGRAPFADFKSFFSKLEAHRTQPPPDVRTLRPDVPAELAKLVQRLLAKKPHERFATAAEAAAALAPFAAASSSPELSPTPPLPATRKWMAKPAKRRWPWLAAAAAGMVLTALVLWLLGRGGPPVHVMTLDVELARKVDGFRLPAGLLGEQAFHPHLDDTVTVEARLTRPAYAFLISFRPDGQAELCFPESEDEPPPLTDNPRYPSTAASANEEYGLSDGVGLQAFAVVVSRKPLPAFSEWWKREHCPWEKTESPPGVMYRANGEDPVQAWNAKGEARSKGVEVVGKTPLAQLADWLRRRPGIETVQVLGFAVEPKEKE